MSRILFLILSIFLLTTPAKSHSWYDWQCCSDKDCHPIESCDDLEDLPDGRVKWGKYIFEKGSIKPSKDSKCHVCIMNTDRPMCVYTQQNS